ncbi:MAG TPA: lyase family protein, partial [Sedimentisphaerales bacterium]|nr:lyase family protein [Sedimentisphaerales bacterium]
SSGPDAGFGELKLPLRQAGSSIMPGKVNPVIAEMAAQVAIQAISRDAAISMAAMSGQLELNAFMPCIAHNLLSMLDELIIACTKVRLLLVQGLEVDREKCEKSLHSSTAIITAFINKIGYEKASEVAVKAVQEKKTVKEVLLAEKLCTQEEYDQLTSAEAILALGFREKTNANDT